MKKDNDLLGSFKEIEKGGVGRWVDRGKFDEIIGALPHDEIEALRAYTGMGYDPINDFLRGRPYKLHAMSKPPAAYTLKIDRALSKSACPEDTLVFRGTSIRTLPRDYWKNPQDLVGKTISEKGYLSASLDKDVVVGEFLHEAPTDVLLVIKTPKGAKGMYVNPVSKAGETEFLMPRDTKLKIISVSQPQGIDGQYYGLRIICEVVQ